MLKAIYFFLFFSIVVIDFVAATEIERQSATLTASDLFPVNASQPMPSLFSSDIGDAYFPSITLEPGDLPDNLPPSNQTSGNVTAQGNWVGTSLYGYNGCKKAGFSKAKINNAYYDMWKLTNRDGIKKNIDWNSAAALEFLGPPANNGVQQESIQQLFDTAASVTYSNLNPYAHYIHVRCDDPRKDCSNQCKPSTGKPNPDQKGLTLAYSMQEDPDDGYSMINFCPPFFRMRRLEDAALNFGKSRTPPLNYWLRNYENTALVFLHELFHLNYFMGTDGSNHVTDMSISFNKRDENNELYTVTEVAYGPSNTKIMARFQELKKYPDNFRAGYYVMRNSDNLAWFALAKYVQDRIGVYPHLPIIYNQINGPPYRDIGGLGIFEDNSNPVFNFTIAGNETTADNITSALGIDDGLPDENSCSDDITATGQTFDTTSAAQNATLNISGMANDTVYPAAYMTNLTSWLESDFGVTPSNSSEATTTTSPTSTPTCIGNQVESSCIADTLPSVTPYAGSQGPSCARADGAAGSAPRLNMTVAQDAASQFCANLVNTNVVLSSSTANPAPDVEAGAAEGGADMVLTAMYDETSCPQDKSNSTLDFGTMGLDACFGLLFTALSEECAEDSTWTDYNPDWTLEGGVYADACGLFTIFSQTG
ncbi:hypothetical protein MMC20_002583 [Loxospora ochrophaea]|nr:hypothetical protein [Loxospora ochrophaea]